MHWGVGDVSDIYVSCEMHCCHKILSPKEYSTCELGIVQAFWGLLLNPIRHFCQCKNLNVERVKNYSVKNHGIVYIAYSIVKGTEKQM